MKYLVLSLKLGFSDVFRGKHAIFLHKFMLFSILLALFIVGNDCF